MDKSGKDLDGQIKFVDLLKQLALVQGNLAKVNAQLAVREGREQVSQAVGSARDSLLAQAKRFGANFKKIDQDYKERSDGKRGILEDYEDSLDSINREYYSLMQQYANSIAFFESQELNVMMLQKQNNDELRVAQKKFKAQESSLTKKIFRARSEKDFDSAMKFVDELQELYENNPVIQLRTNAETLNSQRANFRQEIEKAKINYEKAMISRKKEISSVTEDKNNKLANLPKQGVFRTMLGSLFNKVNGTNKFMKKCFEPFKSKIKEIKEQSIPRIGADISAKKKFLSDKVTETNTRIKDAVFEKASSVASVLVQAQKNSIESAIKLRDSVVSKASALGHNVGQARDRVVEGAKNTKDVAIDRVMRIRDTAISVASGARGTVINAVDSGKRTFTSIIESAKSKKMSF